MKLAAALVSALAIGCGCSAAEAGPVADTAVRAEALQAEGDDMGALEALDDAIAAVWAESPLMFRKVALVDSVGGLGTYDERGNRTFRPDEKLKVYVEPVGYGFGGSGETAKIGFTTDLTIENMTGQVLTEEKNLFSISVDSAPGRREFGMTLSFGVPYLRPGEYIARFTVRDQNSQKSGSFDVPFAVAAPAPGALAPQASDGTQPSGRAQSTTP
jgi:hypothetical protein